MSRVAPSSAGGTTPPQPVPSSEQPPVHTAPPSFPVLPPGPVSRRRRPRWVTPVVVAGSLFVGLGIGSASSGADPTTSDEYKAVVGQLAMARDGPRRHRRSEVRGHHRPRQGGCRRAGRRRPPGCARQAREDARRPQQDPGRPGHGAGQAREDLSGAEKKATASEIEDGAWTVGVDIAPGTYKVKDATGSTCYWAILRTGSNGDDIISNDLPTRGYPSVSPKKGQDLDNQCGTWKKVG